MSWFGFSIHCLPTLDFSLGRSGDNYWQVGGAEDGEEKDLVGNEIFFGSRVNCRW